VQIVSATKAEGKTPPEQWFLPEKKKGRLQEETLVRGDRQGESFRKDFRKGKKNSSL